MIPQYESFTFGDWLRAFRERHRISQQALGEQIGRNRNTLNKWENGRLPEDREDILLLEEALHLSPSETDVLLYTAQFPIKYHRSITEAFRSASAEIGYRSPGVFYTGYGGPENIYGYLLLKWPETRYELNRSELIIGRHPHDCNLVIPAAFTFVSRVHATIYCSQDHVYIEDKESKHGTFIDGERVMSRMQLQVGQHLLLGGRLPRSEVCVLEFSLQPTSTK